MRCLIVGGDGMLGHQLLQSWQARHDVRVTLRNPLSHYRSFGLFRTDNAFDGVDVQDTGRLLKVLTDFRPQAVVNAAGIIKQRPAAHDHLASLEVNALFPHRLRMLCDAIGARMVHLSTDCVFNGRRGGYREQDPADAEDLYGLSKYLGEVADSPCVTLRTSIIGLELKTKSSLIEWFLAQRGVVKGFTRAIYTGFTTAEMARVIERVVVDQPELYGVWQVASDPISKHELLCKLSNYLGRHDVLIEPNEGFACDRRLDGTAFAHQTGYRAPTWDAMLKELAEQIQGKGVYHAAA